MTQTLLIENSFFDGVSVTGNGCIVSLKAENKHIVLRSSVFHNCYASEKGGCVFSEGCRITLKNDVFLKCFVTTNRDVYYGNVIYSVSAKRGVMNDVSSRLCGEVKNKCGDSSIKIDSALLIIRSCNSSDNYGCCGASHFSTFTAYDGSTLRYIQDYKSHDYMVLEIVNCKVKVQYFNIISCQSDYCIFYTNPEKSADFYNCIFIDSPKNLYHKECDFYDCVSNNGHEKYMTTIGSGEELTPRNIFFNNYRTCLKANAQKLRNEYLMIIFLVFTM